MATSNIDLSPYHIFKVMTNNRLQSKDQLVIGFRECGKINTTSKSKLPLFIAVTIDDQMLTRFRIDSGVHITCSMSTHSSN